MLRGVSSLAQAAPTPTPTLADNWQFDPAGLA